MRKSLIAMSAVFAAGVILFLPCPPSPQTGSAVRISISPRSHAPMILHERHGKNVTSGNWAGYAITAPNNGVTYVKGSWVVPAVFPCTAGEPSSYSSFWVGIDGYNTNTVEQIGTESDCLNGVPTYYAWFELYPHPSYTINSFTVHPGDVITAAVGADAKTGKVTLTLDATTKYPGGGPQHFDTTTKAPSAKFASAEWIAEAPWSSKVLPLASFGTALFGEVYTAVAGTNYATIKGTPTSQAIGYFDNGPSGPVYQIDMGSNASKALTSSLTGTNGSSFTVTWNGH